MFLAFVLLILWLLYKWSVSNLDYFKKIGVQYEKPLPVVGNALDLLLKKKNFIDLTRSSYYNFKSSRVFGFFNFMQINYYITDPELIKRITIKDFDHFTNKDNPTAHADKMFGRMLPFLRDKEWTDMRSTLSPIFTSAKMKMMFGLLSDQARDFVNFFEEKSRNGEVLEIDAKDIFARFTANGISTSALGFEADCVRNVNSEVFKLVGNFINQTNDTLTVVKGFLFLAIPKLYRLLGLQLLSKELHSFFKRVVIDQMEERERNNISRPDIIQLMLQLKKGQLKQDKENEVDDKELVNFSANIEHDVKSSKGKNTSQFTDDDWIAQGFVFFGAGFDTTSTLLLTTCYELMKNPDIQLELYNEIDSVASTLDGKSVSFETLHKMTFLDMVVSEGLRKWPPIIQTNRICNKDYDVVLGNGKTITIKKDQLIIFPYYHIQNDPTYFPNPEKFDPHRFGNENKDSVVQGTYLPFGLGRRNCIGSRFALMEAKLLLFNLVQKFSIEKCLKTPETIAHKEGFFSSIKEIIYLKFVPRK